MLKTYKYRLYPTEDQKYQMARIFGCVRFVYNLGLETKIHYWKNYKKSISCFELITQMVQLKKEEEVGWLKEAPAQALQMALRNLDNAFTSFFRKQNKFPKFKSKKSKQSFQLPQEVYVNFEDNKVSMPKIKWVTCIFDRQFTGKIKTCTISKTKTDKYFISVLVDDGKELPKKKKITEKTAVGIDLGIKHFAILSDGTKIENPKFLEKSLNRLRIEQRTLARRFKGKGKEQSAGWNKQKLVVALLYEKIANQRKDFLHKLSTSITKNYNTICIEKLDIAGMLKNKQLSRQISDVGWSLFDEFLKYKAEWQGKNLIQLGQFEPSSKICSVCGAINRDLKLSDRVWTCKNGHELDRDVNAAVNIKDFGLRTKPLLVNVKH